MIRMDLWNVILEIQIGLWRCVIAIYIIFRRLFGWLRFRFTATEKLIHGYNAFRVFEAVDLDGWLDMIKKELKRRKCFEAITSYV